MSDPSMSKTPSPTVVPQEGSALDRRGLIRSAGAALGAGALLASAPRPARAQGRTEITFASAKFFGKHGIGQIVDEFNQSQERVHVTFLELPPPSASTEVHQALVQQLARRNGSPDVFTQDIVWIAEFAAAGWAAPLDDAINAAARKKYFDGLVAACTVSGKLTALPWMVDSGMLYYRTDLLQEIGAKPPKTWMELVDSSKKVMEAGKARFGFLWQAKQAEVLVCDLVSFITSNNGAILGPDGRTVTVSSPEVVEAVQFMHDTIYTHKITPQDVLSWDEEPSRRPFTAGQSLFLRNWSYVWSIAQDASESSVVGKVGVAPLPHFEGGRSAAALGGYQYGVNASSKNRDAALEFVTWMSSAPTQLRFATGMGLAPTRPAVFDDPELGKSQPFMQSLKDVFVGATGRPVTPKYAQVTLALQSEVSRAIVSGDVQGSLKAAQEKIEKIVA
ncbi:MAG TPA: ABC transporter substrate-binding protein [Geminicoccus sp.]|jgi:multiple sugar transport system substrate-binding protein|uniref:ABC transporter substrate-binding protein n=1 Tax=Geminicoccus sp. TaxID=2024832 RepID=UPI002E37F30A|nr:ABC transporter substrate-binding protein [Geminicoccus sp.]HEX2526936.1 ABC transporter substrate-binding protein [Geminicoccus sp.]